MIIKWIVAQINAGKEEAKLRAERKLVDEDERLAWAATALDLMKACPKCSTTNGVIGKHQDCMDVVLDYCSHEWHSANVRHSGTYNNLTRRQALLQFAQKYYPR